MNLCLFYDPECIKQFNINLCPDPEYRALNHLDKQVEEPFVLPDEPLQLNKTQETHLTKNRKENN